MSKKRKTVRWLIVVFFGVAILTKNLTPQIYKAVSPNRQFSCAVYAVRGWGNFLAPAFRLEVVDNLTSEKVLAATQQEFEGWNSFVPLGLKWNNSSDEFKCFWGIQHIGVMSQVFKVKSNPLIVSKSGLVET